MKITYLLIFSGLLIATNSLNYFLTKDYYQAKAASDIFITLPVIKNYYDDKVSSNKNNDYSVNYAIRMFMGAINYTSKKNSPIFYNYIFNKDDEPFSMSPLQIYDTYRVFDENYRVEERIIFLDEEENGVKK